ncbi:MAG: type II toxin-antitoxin system HicB family antitoxin [Myxococcaceae bacterium]
MKYYAILKETPEAIEVEFPDLEGCVTFGQDWDDAIENATDALAAWLAHAEPRFVKKPSSFEELKHLGGTLMAIVVDEAVKERYENLDSKRFNVIFPTNILNRVDLFRKEVGLKRSKLLQRAVEEFLHAHPSGL